MATTSGVLNSSGITVGSNGKISVSGLSSGIDTAALIQAQIAAATVPVDNIKAKISTNNTVIQTYNDLKSKVKSFQTSLDALRNNLAFGSTNVFKQKTGSGSTAAGPLAAPGYTPSDINSLISTSFTSKAQNGSHTITIQQLAQAQQVSSDSQSTSTLALNVSGTVTINGKNINISATDKLVDIRDKINAAGANVNATIVSADSTHHYLLLNSATTGTGSNAISFTQTALSDALGLTNGSNVAKNEKVEARDAIIDVDGIEDITRSSNVISDVIDGVTLNLNKAEPDTVINLTVSADLNAIKTAIGSFVSAYNALRAFIVEQNTPSDRNNDGEVNNNEFGPLYNTSIMRGISDQLSFMNTMTMNSNTDGFRSLGQIGVVVGTDYNLAVDDSVLDPKLLANVDSISTLFGFKFTSSDSRISAVARTNNTVSGTYYLNLTGTDGAAAILGANISDVAAHGTASDGSLTINGNVLTATDTTHANGLVLSFANTAINLDPIADIELSISRGIADNFFDYFDQLTKANGTFDSEIISLNDQNTSYQSQVDTLNTRIENQRTLLTNKYAAMETALARMQQLQNQIDSFFNNSSSNN